MIIFFSSNETFINFNNFINEIIKNDKKIIEWGSKLQPQIIKL